MVAVRRFDAAGEADQLGDFPPMDIVVSLDDMADKRRGFPRRRVRARAFGLDEL